MKFVKLTTENGNQVYINMDMVFDMISYTNNEGQKVTAVRGSAIGGNCTDLEAIDRVVKETPDEIWVAMDYLT